MGTMLGTSYYDTNRLMTVTADDDNDNGCGMQSRENRNNLQASYLYRGHSWRKMLEHSYFCSSISFLLSFVTKR